MNVISRLTLTFTTACLLASPLAAATDSLRLGGAVETPGTWTAARLGEKLAGSVQTVRYMLKGVEHSARAIPLLALLTEARVRENPKVKHHQLANAIVVQGRDGYTVTFSTGELDPGLGDRKVWIALDVDGKPLPENEAPIRLLVPAEAKPSRWIFGITAITVVDGTQLVSAR